MKKKIGRPPRDPRDPDRSPYKGHALARVFPRYRCECGEEFADYAGWCDHAREAIAGDRLTAER